MHEHKIFDLSNSAPVSLEQATKLVGVLTRVTTKHSQVVSDLISVLETLPISDRKATGAIELKINAEIELWNAKIRKLGAQPKGLWLVDIDAGDGYFCWKYPEVEINYWHDYKSGFASRISLTDKEKKSEHREHQMRLRDSGLL